MLWEKARFGKYNIYSSCGHICRPLVTIILLTILRFMSLKRFIKEKESDSHFGSIVYSRAIVFKCQTLLKVVALVNIIEPRVRHNPGNGRAILVAVKSGCSAKMVICKTWTGALANSSDPDQTRRTRTKQS